MNHADIFGSARRKIIDGILEGCKAFDQQNGFSEDWIRGLLFTVGDGHLLIVASSPNNDGSLDHIMLLECTDTNVEYVIEQMKIVEAKANRNSIYGFQPRYTAYVLESLP